MNYKELEAVIAGVTGGQGPFPLQEALIDGETRKVFGGLPENLRDLYLFAASYGDKDCLVYQQQRMSFIEVLGQVLKLADVLSSRYGIEKGSRVAIAMRNCPEWCVAFMAITSIGAVAVPMNSWWQGEELAYAIKDSGSGLVFVDGTRFSRMSGWLEQSGLAVIGFDTGGKPLPTEVDRLEGLLSGDEVPALPPVEILPEDPALILYTSGTTGHPKGVLSTQRNVISAIGTWVVLVSAINVLEGAAEQEPEKPDRDSAGHPAVPCDGPAQHVPAVPDHRSQNRDDAQVGRRPGPGIDRGGAYHPLQWRSYHVHGADEPSAPGRF